MRERIRPAVELGVGDRSRVGNDGRRLRRLRDPAAEELGEAGGLIDDRCGIPRCELRSLVVAHELELTKWAVRLRDGRFEETSVMAGHVVNGRDLEEVG